MQTEIPIECIDCTVWGLLQDRIYKNQSKILHAIEAWWGFTTASDRQRIEALVRRGVRLGFYRRDDPSIAQLVDDMDETLCATVLHSVLRYISPDICTITYCPRPRRHELTLTTKSDSRNFYERLLFKTCIRPNVAYLLISYL